MTDLPGYWMHETSGVLRSAVEAYLTGNIMTPDQVAAMRAYLRQWIGSPRWDENPHATESDREKLETLRRFIDTLTSRQTIEVWLFSAIEMGMDPL
jgi:hypothetical protein